MFIAVKTLTFLFLISSSQCYYHQFYILASHENSMQRLKRVTIQNDEMSLENVGSEIFPQPYAAAHISGRHVFMQSLQQTSIIDLKYGTNYILKHQGAEHQYPDPEYTHEISKGAACYGKGDSALQVIYSHAAQQYFQYNLEEHTIYKEMTANESYINTIDCKIVGNNSYFLTKRGLYQREGPVSRRSKRSTGDDDYKFKCLLENEGKVFIVMDDQMVVQDSEGLFYDVYTLWGVVYEKSCVNLGKHAYVMTQSGLYSFNLEDNTFTLIRDQANQMQTLQNSFFFNPQGYTIENDIPLSGGYWKPILRVFNPKAKYSLAFSIIQGISKKVQTQECESRSINMSASVNGGVGNAVAKINFKQKVSGEVSSMLESTKTEDISESRRLLHTFEIDGNRTQTVWQYVFQGSDLFDDMLLHTTHFKYTNGEYPQFTDENNDEDSDN